MMSTAEVNHDYGIEPTNQDAPEGSVVNDTGVELTNQDAPEAGAVINDTGVELRPCEAAPSTGAVINDTGVEVKPDGVVVPGAVAKKPEKVNRCLVICSWENEVPFL